MQLTAGRARTQRDDHVYVATYLQCFMFQRNSTFAWRWLLSWLDGITATSWEQVGTICTIRMQKRKKNNEISYLSWIPIVAFCGEEGLNPGCTGYHVRYQGKWDCAMHNYNLITRSTMNFLLLELVQEWKCGSLQATNMYCAVLLFQGSLNKLQSIY